MDFVVTWVDNNDLKWREQFNKYKKHTLGECSEMRFRSWDNFHYWFRGVEKFAPWVDKVHFVTWGHIPSWLNIQHPKLNIVRHEDFIPEEYLPTFNSRTIELNFHRIKDLSEEFVIFNDDVFLIDKVRPKMFFVNGKPCDMPIILPFGISEYTKAMLNNLIVINRNFNIKNEIKKKWTNWINFKYGKYNISNLMFLSFMKSHHIAPMNFHIALPTKKSTLDTLWDKEYEVMHDSAKHKFRKTDSVNIALPRYWDLLSNNFHPINRLKMGASISVHDENIRNATSFIKQQMKPILCLNDHVDLKDFDYAKNEVNRALNLILSEKSNFEI